MTMVVERLDRWQVSTQGFGELLTTEAAAPGLGLRLFGQPSGYEASELRNWLEGLARAVSEAAVSAPPDDAVPPMLRDALGGLLFSHGELWSRETGSICSVVLVGGTERIGFGWVGEASLAAMPQDPAGDAEWVNIRDAVGREARAWCGPADREARVELLLTLRPGEPPARLEARWIPDAVAPVAPATGSSGFEAAPMSGADTLPAPSAAPSTEENPSAGVARWLAQHVQWESESASSQAPEPAPAPDLGTELLGAGSAFEEAIDDAPRVGPVDVVAIPGPPAPAEPVMLPEHLPEPAPTLAPEPSPAGPVVERRAPPRHPDWPAPSPDHEERAPFPWRRYAIAAAVIAVLFGVGWFLGEMQSPEGPAETRRSSNFVKFLRGVGLAPPRFEIEVASRPAGAWVAVDGKDLSVRAPTRLELAPGTHKIGLSFPDVGGVIRTVVGQKNDQLAVSEPLWGSLDVAAADPTVPVSLALDGQPLGLVPAHLDSLAPGPHELRFSGTGMASWGSTLELKVGERREVLAYPLQSPATGLIQVRATQSGGDGGPLQGARVWIDSEPRGVTPLTLELPRGPHSVRVAYQQEEAPVQVIDLPGGNQRFATFELGARADFPTLLLRAPATIGVEEPALVSATLSDVEAADVREMWLHVREPENRWRRYPMTLMNAQGSAVGAAPFPVALLGAQGRTSYYVSALTGQGDEYFTEMQTARAASTRR
jgi:hypothetical protein